MKKLVATSALVVCTIAGVSLPALAQPGNPYGNAGLLTGNVRDLNVIPSVEPSPAVKPSPVEPSPAAEPNPVVPARHGKGIAAGDTAYVVVSAATLWTSPTSPRSIDEPALANPADLDAWNSNLDTVAKRRALTGLTQTQAIYGDAVYVWEVKGRWARVGVTTEPDPGAKHGYEAWIPVLQLAKSPDFARANKDDTHVVTVTAQRATVEAVPTASTGPTKIEVPFNTRLPIERLGDDKALVVLPDNRRGWIKLTDVNRFDQRKERPAPKPSQLVETAKQFLGLPYVWGGTSAYGFDCSGFTYSIYRAYGIEIPRDSGPQSAAGTPVDPADLAVGDLIFFASNGGRGSVYHVGMYIGHGKMIHAPNASRTVEIVDWKTWGGAGDFWGIKRFL